MEGRQIQDEGDRYLIDEVMRGSSDAFRRLVDRFNGRLKAFATRKLSGSGLDPEDAVQETFLSLVRNLDKLDDVRSLQAYLFTILRCRIADLARGRGPTAGAVSLDAYESSTGYEPPSPAGTPSAYVRLDEARDLRPTILSQCLDTLLSKLKAEKRFRDLKILELIFSAGKSNKEAAQLANTSEPTVSRTRAQLIADLRKLISKHSQADAMEDLQHGDDVSQLIHTLWNENHFSCIKRSTLGSHALGVIDDDWGDYTRFHLEVVGCPYCQAHLDDISADGEGLSVARRESIFQSSMGFLKE